MSSTLSASTDRDLMMSTGQIEPNVRVDRKLFEDLIGGPGGRPSVDYFDTVMNQTESEIQWSRGLIKDTHAKIAAIPDNVARNKSCLSSDFDARSMRATLKMDVSFTDHSHIIGKGGRSIQSVMNDSNCHIHFPDSNRTNTFEKSNQVSIAGSAVGAEKARCRIRQLLPLTVYYDLPLSCFPPQAFDATNPVIQAVQQNFALVVSLKQLRDGSIVNSFGGNNYVRMSIRGTRSQVLGLRQGIAILLEQLTNGMFSFNTAAVSLDTEVAAQHHAFLMGRGNVNVRAIQQSYGVLIKFPDNSQNTLMAMPAASSVPLKRSTVTVTGSNFDSVFMGWQELLGYLPLVLIFDLKEDEDVDAAMVTQMMEKLKISIIIKPKMKQNIKSIMVRGPEKDSRVLFEVRRQILCLGASEVPYCCDEHYTRQSNSDKATTASALNPVTLPKQSILQSTANIWSTPASSKSQMPEAENKDPNAGSIGLPPGYESMSESFGKLWSYESKSTYPSTSTEDSPDTVASEDNIFESSVSSYKFSRPSTPTSFKHENVFKYNTGRPSSNSSAISQFWSKIPSTEDADEYFLDSAGNSRATSVYDFAVTRPASASTIAFNSEPTKTNEDNSDLNEVLAKLDLMRFADRFQGMSVGGFLNLTEKRLNFLGFGLLERHSILEAINKLKTLCSLVGRSAESEFGYHVAPGAERKYKGV